MALNLSDVKSSIFKVWKKIKATFKIDENIIKDENEKKANAIHQTLMGNWKNKLFESNSFMEKK